MTAAQRSALFDLCTAIQRCDCAPADIRIRANSLQFRLAFDTTFFRAIFGRG